MHTKGEIAKDQGLTMLCLDEDKIGTIKVVVAQEHASQVVELIKEHIDPSDEPHTDLLKEVSKSGIELDVARIEVNEVYDPLFHSTYDFLVDARIPAIILITCDSDKAIITCLPSVTGSDVLAITTMKTISTVGVFNAAERLADEAQDLEGFKRLFAAYRDSFSVDYGLLINQAKQAPEQENT